MVVLLLLRINQQQQGEKKQLKQEPDLILILVPRRAAPSAEFSVDRSRHIMSFLTMLGPSPDWNVGLTAEDLCTKECGWVQKVVQDLIPWDAGTDSGVTYEVRPCSFRPAWFPSLLSSSCLHADLVFTATFSTSSACLLTSAITPSLTFSHSASVRLFMCHRPSNSRLTALNVYTPAALVKRCCLVDAPRLR